MIIFAAILVFLVFYQIRFRKAEEDYLEPLQCTAVRGIFALIIFLSHAKGYVTLSDSLSDRLFLKMLYMFGQAIVAMYFFYSGYGIIESVKNKAEYTKHFFHKRIVKTLVHFDLAVVLFMILNLAFGKVYYLRTYLLSLTGWVSIGNSNWFMCVILILYVLTWLAMNLTKKMKLTYMHTAYMVCVMSVLLWVVFDTMSRGGYWYNTLLCYGEGMLYACYRRKIDRVCERPASYACALLCVLMMIGFCYLHRGTVLIYSVFSILFCLLVVFITMKLRIDNRYLNLFGRYSFSFFILQRLPMIALTELKITEPTVFTLLSLICTILLAYFFDLLLRYTDSKILRI